MLLFSTPTGLYQWSGQTEAEQPQPILPATPVRALAQGERMQVASVDGDLRYRRDGDAFKAAALGLDHRIDSLLILSEQPLRVLIGTAEACLFIFHESQGLTRLEHFDHLPVREKWYTPWGGPPAVRSLAGTPDRQTLYADIHVGSIMRSDNEGKSWQPVTPTLNEDVHQVAASPAAPDRVVANTANAVYVSDDRGQTWQHRAQGLSARYGRAVAIHPQAPDCLLASVSRGPRGGEARLFRSDDAGRTWRHVTTGFPADSERNIDTFQIAFDGAGLAWAAVGQTLYRSGDRGATWEPAWQAPEPIGRIACRAG